MLKSILSIFQFILAILFVIAVLLQQRGSGLGAAFGGSSNIYSTKRGVDKMLFNITIVLVVLFFLVSLLVLVI